jgi:hypothetical protein
MTATEASVKQRRILVAMDSNAESLAGLRRAATLASELRIELAGLFLEDINLLRMSELPGHEIILGSGSRKSTSRAEMEQQMRHRAAAARREVERLAQAFSLSWTFEVRRAGLDSALREAARSNELVCSALAPPPLPHAAARPRTSRRRAVYPHGPVRAPRPVLALYEGAEGGARVLELAQRAAQINHLPLEVLVPARAGAAGQKAVDEANRCLSEAEEPVTVRRLPQSEKALLNALAAARGQLLFLDAASQAATAEHLASLRSAAKCDLLLVSRH